MPNSKLEQLNNPNSSIQDLSEIRSIQQRDFQEMPTIVIPIEEDENLLLISLGKRLAILDFDDNKILDELDFSSILADKERFNDGKCDKNGRLFIGTMYVEADGSTVPGKGSLFRLDGRKLTRIFANTNISNGMAWTKDNTKLYFNDSADRLIYEFNYNLENGEISDCKILVDLKENEFDGCEAGAIECPDGMTIDNEDKLWIALWGGNRVIRFDPIKNVVLHSQTTGSSQTTSICNGKLFGHDALFVTSAFKSTDLNKRNSGRSFVIYSNKGNFIHIYSNFFKRSLLN